MLISFAIGFILLLVAIELFFVFRKRRKISRSDQEFILAQWEIIGEDLRRHPHKALIEADKLLDFALRVRGYEGSLGEKLKKAGGEFSRIDDVWEAHKLRNRLAHEVGFKLSPQVVKVALAKFRTALADLGVQFPW